MSHWLLLTCLLWMMIGVALSYPVVSLLHVKDSRLTKPPPGGAKEGEQQKEDGVQEEAIASIAIPNLSMTSASPSLSTLASMQSIEVQQEEIANATIMPGEANSELNKSAGNEVITNGTEVMEEMISSSASNFTEGNETVQNEMATGVTQSLNASGSEVVNETSTETLEDVVSQPTLEGSSLESIQASLLVSESSTEAGVGEESEIEINETNTEIQTGFATTATMEIGEANFVANNTANISLIESEMNISDVAAVESVTEASVLITGEAIESENETTSKESDEASPEEGIAEEASEEVLTNITKENGTDEIGEIKSILKNKKLKSEMIEGEPGILEKLKPESRGKEKNYTKAHGNETTNARKYLTFAQHGISAVEDEFVKLFKKLFKLLHYVQDIFVHTPNNSTFMDSQSGNKLEKTILEYDHQEHANHKMTKLLLMLFHSDLSLGEENENESKDAKIKEDVEDEDANWKAKYQEENYGLKETSEEKADVDEDYNLPVESEDDDAEESTKLTTTEAENVTEIAFVDEDEEYARMMNDAAVDNANSTTVTEDSE